MGKTSDFDPKEEHGGGLQTNRRRKTLKSLEDDKEWKEEGHEKMKYSPEYLTLQASRELVHKVMQKRKLDPKASNDRENHTSPSRGRPLSTTNRSVSSSSILRGKLENLSRSQKSQLLVQNKTTSQSRPPAVMKKEGPRFRDTGMGDKISKLYEEPPITKVFGPPVKPPLATLPEKETIDCVIPANPKASNKIMLHVYDLIQRDALMLLPPPFGCVVEIGKCFADLNSTLHDLGTGAYHVGIEVNGIEYAFGACSTRGRTGVFSCFPKTSPGYQYRTTIDLGERPLVKRLFPVVKRGGRRSEEERPVEATTIMREMASEYMGTDYDILRKNCCSFACDACRRLGVLEEEIPSWFRNLAESGAATQDVASAAIQPIASIASVLSTCDSTR